MVEYDYINLLLSNLFTFLTKRQDLVEEYNIFRKHNNKLEKCGELSFPLNNSAWKKYIHNEVSELPILQYLQLKNDDEKIYEDLIEESKSWTIPIIKCSSDYEKLNIFLNRPITFQNVITYILSQKNNYGKVNLSYKSFIKINIDNKERNVSVIDLTQLRIILLENVINNLLQFTGNDIENKNSEIIHLTNRSNCVIDSKKIICGVVVSNKFGKKNTNITAQEYYNKRTVDMRLMAQHKYGLRVNSESGWAEFFERLGTAAVAIDLLHVKPSRPIVINIENATASHSKGASFILYNCARLSAIFKQFDQKVAAGIYPSLPELNEIDFTLLNQPEEWEILYVYLMHYPEIVKNCIKDITDCKINIHNLCTFLDSLCSIFSIYYRRVRILTEPRVHLFPVLQARIYLLKSIQEVLHNALALLNIPPVKQM